MQKIRALFKKEREQLQRELRQRVMTDVATAFGIVAGLAWNETVKSLIEYFFPHRADTLLAKFIYASLMTIAAVFVTIYLTRLLEKKSETVVTTEQK